MRNDAQASERLRQERETFDERKAQGRSWFRFRLVVGYSSIALMLGVAVVAGIIVLNPSSHAREVVTLAGGALLIDILGLVVWLWRYAFQNEAATLIAPVTNKPRKP